jgi:hypothetical protein
MLISLHYPFYEIVSGFHNEIPRVLPVPVLERSSAHRQCRKPVKRTYPYAAKYRDQKLGHPLKRAVGVAKMTHPDRVARHGRQINPGRAAQHLLRASARSGG